MNKTKSVKGQCFCGAIQFELSFPTDFCSHCHCNSCRKAHGSAFVTWTSVPVNQFRFLSGVDKIKKYNSSADVRWGFCSTCGTSLLYEHARTPNKVYVTVANLNGSLDRPPEEHVSFEEHADWFTVNDGLPKFRAKSDERM